MLPGKSRPQAFDPRPGFGIQCLYLRDEALDCMDFMAAMEQFPVVLRLRMTVRAQELLKLPVHNKLQPLPR